jgi:hypothetical protein
LIGSLEDGTSFRHHVDPGTHSFTARTTIEDAQPVTVEAGEVYSVEGYLQMGVVVGHPKLRLVDQTKGAAAYARR